MNIAEVVDVSAFADFVGDSFSIEIGPDEFAVSILVEAAAIRSQSQDGSSLPRHPFTLLFAVEGDVNLPQQTYRLRHDKVGELHLFLVPVGGGQMESIFN